MTYWHELSKKEQDKIAETGITVEDFLVTYKQPDWCNYHAALTPLLGCWKLFTKRVDYSSCLGCELMKKTEDA